MKHPLLYRIGIDKKCFSMFLFMRWFLYGFWHAGIIYMLTFYFLTYPGQQSYDYNMDLGFWCCGHIVYTNCVAVANVVMFHQYNNLAGYGEILAFASWVVCYTILFLQQYVTFFPQTYYLFDQAFIQPITWIATFIAIGQASVTEIFSARIRKFW